ncbi:E3 ubiquitin-protein ligase RNF216-like [Pelobates fuscus]|uniref:E3 ubiquitin-protein ligase RNF216-like n=1 Tax=Pelobates fuscus TaxID=191477 RepID=UPI002FE48146
MWWTCDRIQGLWKRTVLLIRKVTNFRLALDPKTILLRLLPDEAPKLIKKMMYLILGTLNGEKLIQDIQREAEREQRKEKGDGGIKRIGPPIQGSSPKAARLNEVPEARHPQNLNHPEIRPFPILHPTFPLPPVQPIYNNLPLNMGARPSQYVPPLPNIRLFPPPPMPMHYGPQPQRE